MNYKLNLGGWNSVFAVPTDVVDKYIKIAGGSSVKVLLFFLRHSGEDLDIDYIAQQLAMNKEDVCDAFVFWQQVGLLEKSDDVFIPAQAIPERKENSFAAEQSSSENAEENEISAEEQVRLAIMKTAALRTPEFSPREIADTVKSDERIAYIFKMCEQMFGRPLKSAEQKALVVIVNHIGLPADVTLMMIDYCNSIGKCTPAYMQSMAMDWVENGITDFSSAEKHISILQAKNTAENTVRKIFGINRALSQKEKDFAALWMNEWGFSADVITVAYEINVDLKGNSSFNYVNKILENWHIKGLTTKEQVINESRSSKPLKQSASSLNISEIDKSILDEYN